MNVDPSDRRWKFPGGILFLMLLVFTVEASDGSAQDAQKTSPEAGEKTHALLITGGCCHDYQNQKKIISDSLSQRIGDIEWTILQYGTGRDIKADVYQQADWIEAFDIVVHNECFGGVEDPMFVQGIVDAHVKSQVPAIAIHCSMHSYRHSPAADSWRALLGVTSVRHERSKHSLKVVPTAAGKSHPITAPIEPHWDTPNGELYIIEDVWPTTTVLAEVHSKETEKNEPVIWTNEYKGVRVFGISLGHHNETMESPIWQQILANGYRWALAR